MSFFPYYVTKSEDIIKATTFTDYVTKSEDIIKATTFTDECGFFPFFLDNDIYTTI